MGSTTLITRVIRSASDFATWDAALRDNPGGHYRHASWWLESLRRIGINGWILTVSNCTEILAGAGVLEFGIPFLRRTVLVVLHGPVVLGCSSPSGLLSSEQRAALTAFAQALRELAIQKRALLVQLTASPSEAVAGAVRFAWPADKVRNELLWDAYTTPDPYCSLALAGGVDALWRIMNQTTRRKIRKAIEKGVTVETVSDVRDLQAVHALWAASGERKKFQVRPFDSAGHAMAQAIQSDMGDAFLAKVNGCPAAGSFVARAGRKAHYVFGGFDDRFADVSPMVLLQWTAIGNAVDHGCLEYDLGNYSNDGVGRFKLGFGAEVKSPGTNLALVHNPWLWSAVDCAWHAMPRRWIRRWIRRRRGFVHTQIETCDQK